MPEQSRQRVPEGFTCERNDLTVYTGVVSRYQRARGRTTLRIRTDWETTEAVTVTHQGTDDPSVPAAHPVPGLHHRAIIPHGQILVPLRR